jgi:O-methyltransferase
MSILTVYRRLDPENPLRALARILRRYYDISVLQLFGNGSAATMRVMDEGGKALVAGDFDRAIDRFRRVYRSNPSNRIYLGEYARALATAGLWKDLSELAANVNFRIFDPTLPAYLHDLSALERRIFVEIALEACQSPPAVAQLCRAVAHLVEHRVAGDFVECGVFRGASIVCMVRRLQSLSVTDRDIWLYDTFEGMPEPESVDRFYSEPEGEQFKSWERTKRQDGGSDWVRADLDEVKKIVLRCGYPAERLHFIKGLVEETIPQTMPESIALLRLDTDFYASTKHELLHLYPRVVSGGVVIIDDYGAYRGARQAVDEYLAENGLHILLARIDEHVRMFTKP